MMYLHTIGLVLVISAFYKTTMKLIDDIFTPEKEIIVTPSVIMFISIIFYVKYYMENFLVR